MSDPEPDATRYEHRHLVMDRLRRRVAIGDRVLTLTMREFTLLEYFLQRPGQVVTRASIAAAVWETAQRPATNLIDVYVLRLRRKLACDHAHGPNIHTVRGVGYALD